jgi:hypothetical protein
MPNEILSTIFSFSQSEEAATKAVCRVAAVCQCWRSAAISHAALWSTIHISSRDISSVAKASAHFTRSKGAPLSVTLCTQKISAKFVRLLSRHSSRIQSLRLDTFHKTLLQISRASLNLPILERLMIANSVEDSSELPPLFPLRPPTLRYLTIECFTTWPIESFVNLTTLHLRDDTGWAPISIDFFINLLEANPALQELKVDSYGPVSDANPVQLPRIAKLPFLDHIVFKYCDSFLFLSHISTEAKRINILDNLAFNRDMRDQSFNHVFGALPANFFHQSDRSRPSELRISGEDG